ncbi:DNA-binding response OmpR family regulator [Variovorax boronicumulans]|uniref:response regulator transcription factor n=1 Tax=Variovorax boronicumulans TaxID=436515 RepID=UPI00277F9EB4|nr:response regulator transcription factor [Variovorax boronicumulans]MDQ0013677.1 DNA-binding response OmpR family regulator [Variovorax boronicumulans]
MFHTVANIDQIAAIGRYSLAFKLAGIAVGGRFVQDEARLRKKRVKQRDGMRIAILDNERDQLRLVTRTATNLGHECHEYTDGALLLQAVQAQRFDLLIFHWRLSGLDSPALVKALRREAGNRLPILFTTHSADAADMAMSLHAGADDFLISPISEAELEARIGGLLRRSYPALHEPQLVFGPYQFLPAWRTVKLNGVRVELRNREYDLALFLFQNTGRLLSREHLYQAIWGADFEALSRSLDTHLSRVRAKLDLRPANGFLLAALRGLGYRLEAVSAQEEIQAPPVPQEKPMNESSTTSKSYTFAHVYEREMGCGALVRRATLGHKEI